MTFICHKCKPLMTQDSTVMSPVSGELYNLLLDISCTNAWIVYKLTFQDGRYRIGSTSDWHQRLYKLNSEFGNFTVCFLESGCSAYDTAMKEAIWHRRLHSYQHPLSINHQYEDLQIASRICDLAVGKLTSGSINPVYLKPLSPLVTSADTLEKFKSTFPDFASYPCLNKFEYI